MSEDIIGNEMVYYFDKDDNVLPTKDNAIRVEIYRFDDDDNIIAHEDISFES
jgi:hypothetical protein